MNLALVIYTNPIEEWLWESGAILIGIIGLLSVLFICGVYLLCSSVIKNWRGEK